MSRIVILTIALSVTWVFWSGSTRPLLLGLGVLSIIITLWVSARMQLTQREFFTLDLVTRLLRFWAYLLVEIARANLTVVRIILSPSLPISPTMLALRNPCSGFIGQATLANSITLTPGTLTLDADESEFLIHCLTEKGAQEVLAGDMSERVVRSLGGSLMFLAAFCAIAVTMVLALVRAMLGPSVYDRVLAVNMFGTKTALLLAVASFVMGRPDFIDMALAYALINFISVLAVLEFSYARRIRQDYKSGSEPDA